MKVAVFGATGNSGLQLVEQALKRGHTVSAIVRNPDALKSFAANPNFKAIKADLLNKDELAGHLTGHDCVLSALGVAGVKIFKITFYLDSMKSIVEAMRTAGIKRLVAMTSFYSKPDPNYPNVYSFVLRPMIGRQLDNMHEMETYLFEKCQDIDFTIVRPPRLLDAPLEETKEVVNEDAHFFPDYSTRSMIPRANVARFMLDCIQGELYIKKGVAVDMPKLDA